jgi:dTDP-4-dehydrorhamnose reductase
LIYKNLNNIAITGGSGTLGMLFPKQCKRLKTRLEESTFKFLNELRNITPKIKTVVHLAGMSSVKKCEENKQMTDKINVLGSMNLLKACNIYGIGDYNRQRLIPGIIYSHLKKLEFVCTKNT